LQDAESVFLWQHAISQDSVAGPLGQEINEDGEHEDEDEDDPQIPVHNTEHEIVMVRSTNHPFVVCVHARQFLRLTDKLHLCSWAPVSNARPTESC
jgi:hypothetical protein